ncbi:hypothetical protein B0H14DRAFT_3167728 [Mycena olivaceomarginata]|nr:hypothetical protein B0H14DRAFT_3167728 [Mycena olivaceomarginata]
MSSDLLADITAKRHGGTNTRLTNVAAEVAEGKRDIEGKSIVNPYQQRWAFDGWNMMIETVKTAEVGQTHANEAVPKSPTSPTRSGSGIALLDSIFASASAASTPASTPASAPRTRTRTTNIHSPTPSSSTSISSRAPPQVLNHDVITSLVGLPRAGSAASAGSGYSNSSASGRHMTSSREGDNECEEEGDGETPEDPESEGSTVLDEEEEEEGLNGAAGRGIGSGRPLLGPTPKAGTRSLPVVNGTGAQMNGSGNNSKNGKASRDVTPRAPVPGNGIAHGQKRAASVPVLPPMSQSSSTGTVRPHAAAHSQSHPQHGP